MDLVWVKGTGVLRPGTVLCTYFLLRTRALKWPRTQVWVFGQGNRFKSGLHYDPVPKCILCLNINVKLMLFNALICYNNVTNVFALSSFALAADTYFIIVSAALWNLAVCFWGFTTFDQLWRRDFAALARDKIQKLSSLAVSMELPYRVSKMQRERKRERWMASE